MEDIFGQIECTTKSDSVVMRILRSAMDEAHGKLQSSDGPIQFLHDRSTFYELATTLVEGGLAIVRDEKTESTAAHCDNILSDLTEIKSWLAGRTRDMRHLIADKDRELARLQQSLELKEREISHLHERLEPCRADDDYITRLEDSVGRQVLSMKQKLDEERRALSVERRNRRTRVSSPNLSFEFLDMERSGGPGPIFRDDDEPNNRNVLLLRKMSSDMDVLKETLDLAFSRMQSAAGANFPSENKWACAVERDVESTLIKGFIYDLRCGPGLGPSRNAVERVKVEIGEIKQERNRPLFKNSEDVLLPITELEGMVCKFEHALEENVESKCMRLQSLKYDVDALVEPFAAVRNRKLMYKKAFVSRCRSLMLAEAEVDLLGDQVESFLCLFESIYFELNKNAKFFSSHSQVHDILKVIRRELNDGS